MRRSVLPMLLLLACNIEFDPRSDGDLFTCERDDDCLVAEGYVCGGHLIDGREVRSYCVKEAEATLAFTYQVRSPFPSRDASGAFCRPFELSTLSYETRLAVSDGADHVFTAGGAEAESAATCTGAPDPYGNGRFLCTVKSATAKTAAMWVTYADGADTLAVMFAKAEVPASRPHLIDAGSVEAFDLDVADPSLPADAGSAASSARCSGRAQSRVALCFPAGGGPDCSCTSGAAPVEGDCPPYYFCAGNGQCFQAHERGGGEACTSVADRVCVSETCGPSNVCQ